MTPADLPPTYVWTNAGHFFGRVGGTEPAGQELRRAAAERRALEEAATERAARLAARPGAVPRRSDRRGGSAAAVGT